jgi:hypothetical protein
MQGNPRFGSLKATTFKKYETEKKKAGKKRGSKKKK